MPLSVFTLEYFNPRSKLELSSVAKLKSMLPVRMFVSWLAKVLNSESLTNVLLASKKLLNTF